MQLTAAQVEALLVEARKGVPDANRGPELLKILWSALAVSVLVVTLRLLTKFRASRRLYADDAFMVGAMVVCIVHACVITKAVGTGLGRHLVYLTVAQTSETIKTGAVSLGLGYLSPVLGRISFCCTVMYLTKTDSRMKIWPIWIVIVLQVIVNVTGIVLFYVQCGTDIDAMWSLAKSLNYNSYCWDPRLQTYYGYGMGVVNTLTDLFLSVLPAVLIEHTKLSRKSKIGLWCLLCLSIFAMVASIVKTYEAKILSAATDFTYDHTIYVIWNAVELNVVIVTASAPLLRPLFQRKAKAPEVQHWPSRVALDSSASSTKRLSRYWSSPQNSSVSSFDAIVTPEDKSAGITVTREVEVRYESMDAPHLHAALVGLVQGERNNPRLART